MNDEIQAVPPNERRQCFDDSDDDPFREPPDGIPLWVGRAAGVAWLFLERSRDRWRWTKVSLLLVAVLAIYAAVFNAMTPLRLDARSRTMPEDREWIYSPLPDQPEKNTAATPGEQPANTLALSFAAAGPLDGSWVQVSVEIDGAKVDNARPSTLIVKGDTYTATRGDLRFSGTVAVNVKADPPHLDLLNEDKMPLVVAVYRLDGDTLTVCWQADEQRPDGIKGGKGRTVAVYKRVKAKP